MFGTSCAARIVGMQPFLHTQAHETEPGGKRQPGFPPAFWIAVAAAAALRIAFAASYLAHLVHRAAAPFAFESGNIAASLATGHGFASPLGIPSGPTAWVAPVYPTLLAGIFRLLGVKSFAAFIAATGLNILFAVLVCIPLYAVATRVAGRRAGLIACWLWAVYPNAILLTYQSMWDGCLSALLGIVVLWATLRLKAHNPRPSIWALYGILWALLLLTNPVFVAVSPFLFVSTGRRRALLALAVAILCVLPWTLRNRRVLHAWVPVRTDLGLALWLGNNPRATVPWHGQQHPLDDLAQRAQFVEHGEVPYMRAKFTAALQSMAAHPQLAAARAGQRFRAFWSGGTPHPLHAFAAGSWTDRYVLASDLLLALAALAGILFLFRRRHPVAWPLAIFPLLIPCAYYLTEAIPRYRLAIDPEVILLAAICLATYAGLHPHPRPQ